VGTDVPVVLCTAALENADDGVSSCALEALAILTLTSSAMAGTLADDELLRNVQAISAGRPSPYASSLADLTDEDPSIPQMELCSRIYENVLVPRLWRLVHRVLNYESSQDVVRVLPFLTSCLVHLVKLMPSTTLGMDRATYAKRWIEVDSLGLVELIVKSILLPSLSSGVDGALCHTAALSALRLTNVCYDKPWTRSLCAHAANILEQQLSVAPLVLEDTLSLLASLLIALRALPVTERTEALETVINQIRLLPATVVVPATVTSAAVKIGKYYRPSARVGLLTEVALSIMVDGPAPTEGSRSHVLKVILASSPVNSLLTARSRQKRGSRGNTWASNQSVSSNTGGDAIEGSRFSVQTNKTPNENFLATHVAEEFVLAICKVGSAVGGEVMNHPLSEDAKEWLRCAMVIASSSCSACVNWKSRLNNAGNEDEFDYDSLFTLLTACQASYIELMVNIFHATGYAAYSTSVTLHLLPQATPTHVFILEDLAQSISNLAKFKMSIHVPSSETQNDVFALVDQFLEYKLREGVPSRHIRVSLLAIFSDHWVQSLARSEEGDSTESSTLNMNDMNARELLTMLSSEISVLSKDLHEAVGDNTTNLNYLDVCVGSVENIALTACDWARRFGTAGGGRYSEAFRRDVDDDVSYIVSTAKAALEGKNLREIDVLDANQSNDGKSLYPVPPVCVEAIKRIDSESSENLQQLNLAAKHLVYSLLVTTACRDMERRSNASANLVVQAYSDTRRSPFIVNGLDERAETPLVASDASVYSYFAQYCFQVIGSRVDPALLDASFTRTDEAHGSARRPNNWLRLSAPPTGQTTGELASRVRLSGTVATISGASDPVAFIIAYSMRKCLRYDCELEFRLFVSMRVQNVTAVKLASGLRMDLRVTQQRSAFEVEGEETDEDQVLASYTAVFKQEIKGGDQVTWEVPLENWPIKGTFELHPSVTFRELKAEHFPPKMVTMSVQIDEESEKDDASSDGTDGRSEDNTITSMEERTIGEDEDDTLDVVLSGEPFQLSPMLGLQPCPLVFFKDRAGDENIFRYLWYQMPFRMPEMTLYANQLLGNLIGSSRDDFGAGSAMLSCIMINEFIESVGKASRGWAFVTFTGNRLLCLMVESINVDESGIESPSSALYFRADDEALLFTMMGSDATRNAVVSSLTENKWTCDSQASGLFGY
jgi:hypothetical protein